MRIIAGERRGHKIDGPKGQGTRPTSDLVRESVFNILGGRVVGRVVVDLFAGTGALGLEALSRGAARAVFVERNRENVALIHRNLATLRYEDRVRVLATDAYRWVRGFTPVDNAPMVVLIDPPYREYENHPGRVRRLLADLSEKLPAGSVVALESGRALGEEILPEPDAWDVRRYGSTQVAIRTVAGPDDDEPSRSPDADHDPEPSPEPEADADADPGR
jgi:16S rRNA (guanine966-N2)-methyltransferase